MGNPYYQPAAGTSTSPYANAQGYGLGAQAVALAARYLGVPYVWGGTSPNGFDCSGLTQFVYNKLGIKLPRTSQEQAKVGIPVSKTDLQPGDLLFFNESRGPNTHVAIYAGNGQEIAAPHTGAKVRVQAVDWAHFSHAMRESGGSSSGALPASFTPPAAGGAPTVATSGATVPVGFHLPGTPWDIPTPGDAISGIEGAAAGVSRTLTRVGIMLPLVAGGTALIVLGFVRGTGLRSRNPMLPGG